MYLFMLIYLFMILLVCDLNVRSTPNFVVQKATLTEEKQKFESRCNDLSFKRNVV